MRNFPVGELFLKRTDKMNFVRKFIIFSGVAFFAPCAVMAANEYLVLSDQADVYKRGKPVRQLHFPDVVAVGSIQNTDDRFVGELPDGDIDLDLTSYIDQSKYEPAGDSWNGFEIRFYVPRMKYQNKIVQGPEIKYFSDKLIVFATSLLTTVDLKTMLSVSVNGKKIYYSKEIDDEIVGYKQMSCIVPAGEGRWCAISVIYHPANRLIARRIAFSLQAVPER